MLLKFSSLVLQTLPPLSWAAISSRGKVYIDFLKDISGYTLKDTLSAGWIRLFQSHCYPDRSSTGKHSPSNTVPHWFWQLTAKADLYLLVSFWVCKVWWTQILSFYSGTAKKKHALEETSLSSKQTSANQRQVTFPNYFSPHETGKAEAVKYGESSCFPIQREIGSSSKRGLNLSAQDGEYKTVKSPTKMPISAPQEQSNQSNEKLEMLQFPLQQSPSIAWCLLKVICKSSMKTTTRMTEDRSAY